VAAIARPLRVMDRVRDRVRSRVRDRVTGTGIADGPSYGGP